MKAVLAFAHGILAFIKRYASFCAGIFVGAMMAQAPALVTQFLGLMWAFFTTASPERLAFIAFDTALIVTVWQFRKYRSSRRARLA